jgi:hypothetical protein
MDLGPFLLLVLVAAAGVMLFVARGAPSDDGDAAAVAAAFLRPWLDVEPRRSSGALEEDEPVRWRVELVRPRGSSPGPATAEPRVAGESPARGRVGDVARLGR